jgi:hypothetical protein
VLYVLGGKIRIGVLQKKQVARWPARLLQVMRQKENTSTKGNTSRQGVCEKVAKHKSGD